MLDSLILRLQQRDLDLEAARLEQERKAEELLRAARRENGIYNISDYQQWLEDGVTKRPEAASSALPASTERPHVDVQRSSSRFPAPPTKR